jgi:hypothetical protein
MHQSNLFTSLGLAFERKQIPRECHVDEAPFLRSYNRRFARISRDAQKAWRPAPENLERIVSNDNVVQWDGRRLQIHPQRRRYSFAGAKVQIYQALNGRVSLYYRDTRLQHSNLAGG